MHVTHPIHPAPRNAARPRTALALVLLVYLALGAGFAARTPPWQAPDEPAHYNYVAQVARQGCCPVIEPGDWDKPYIDQLTTARFHPDLLGRLGELEYEDHQPPLYYLLASLLFTVTDGSLLALRLFSVVIGAGVVWSAYAVGRVMVPERPQIAVGAAAFVGFLPQHLAGLASVNNDGLAELVVGLALLATVVYVKGGRVPPLLLGLLVGAGLLVKLNTLFLAGLVPLALVGRWWLARDREPAARLVPALAAFALPALAVPGLWWLRNIGVYGMPDLFGLRAHDAVVADQPRTADLIAEVGVADYLRRGVETTFNSFWGQFGWMALPMPGWIYTLILALVAAVVVGLVIDRTALRGRNEEAPDAGQRLAWTVLALAVVAAVMQYLYYNTEFLQFQGRYLFPALIPTGLWMAIGLDAWARLAGGASRLRWLAPVGLALLAALDIFVLWRVIPGLAP